MEENGKYFSKKIENDRKHSVPYRPLLKIRRSKCVQKILRSILKASKKFGTLHFQGGTLHIPPKSKKMVNILTKKLKMIVNIPVFRTVPFQKLSVPSASKKFFHLSLDHRKSLGRFIF